MTDVVASLGINLTANVGNALSGITDTDRHARALALTFNNVANAITQDVGRINAAVSSIGRQSGSATGQLNKLQQSANAVSQINATPKINLSSVEKALQINEDENRSIQAQIALRNRLWAQREREERANERMLAQAQRASAINTSAARTASTPQIPNQTVHINGNASGLLNAIESGKSALGNLVSTAVRAGAAITAALAFTVGAGIGAGVNQAADFQTSMNVLQATAGATDAQMNRVRETARALGADMNLAATSDTDAANAMLSMVQNGVSLENAINGARGAVELSSATNISNARSAEIAANASNAFGIAGNNLNRVMDQLAAASQKGANIEQIADAYAMAATNFNTYQSSVVGAEQASTYLTTSIALLGQAGLKGSDAGTSLNQMMMHLAGPTDDARRQMQRAAQQIGITGNLAYDASGRMRPLPEIINNVARATQGMNQATRDAFIKDVFGSDSARAVNILTSQGVAGFTAMEAAVSKEGAAAELAAARTKGFGGSLEGIKSQIQTASNALFTPLLNPLEGMTRNAAAQIGALPWGQWGSNAATLFSAGMSNLSQLGNAFAPLGNAVASTFNGMGPVIQSALSTGFTWLLTNAPTITNNLLTIGGAVQSAITTITPIATQVGGALINGLGSGFNWIVANGPMVIGAVVGLGAALAAPEIVAGAAAIGGAIAAINWPIVALGAAGAALGAAWATDWNGIRTATVNAWNGMQPTLAVVGSWLMTNIPVAINATVGAFQGAWGFLNNNVIPIFNAVGNVMGAIMRKELELVVGAWNGFTGAARAAWNELVETNPWIKTVADAISFGLGNALTAGNNQLWGFKGFWDNVAGAIQNVIGWLNNVASAINNIKLPGWMNGGAWTVSVPSAPTAAPAPSNTNYTSGIIGAPTFGKRQPNYSPTGDPFANPFGTRAAPAGRELPGGDPSTPTIVVNTPSTPVNVGSGTGNLVGGSGGGGGAGGGGKANKLSPEEAVRPLVDEMRPPLMEFFNGMNQGGGRLNNALQQATNAAGRFGPEVSLLSDYYSREAEAQRRLTDANERLKDATDNVTRAQEDLTAAQERAEALLTPINSAKSDLDKAVAQDRYEEEEKRLSEAYSKAEAKAKGKSADSEEAKEAARRLRALQQHEIDHEAERQKEQAQKEVDAAQDKVDRAKKEQERAQKEVNKAQDEVNAAKDQYNALSDVISARSDETRAMVDAINKMEVLSEKLAKLSSVKIPETSSGNSNKGGTTQNSIGTRIGNPSNPGGTIKFQSTSAMPTNSRPQFAPLSVQMPNLNGLGLVRSSEAARPSVVNVAAPRMPSPVVNVAAPRLNTATPIVNVAAPQLAAANVQVTPPKLATNVQVTPPELPASRGGNTYVFSPQITVMGSVTSERDLMATLEKYRREQDWMNGRIG